MFIVKIKNNMTVCILGNSLTALTLAKALAKQNIYVDILYNKKNRHISKSRTIGISKSNTDYLNQNVININKLVWKLKKIEIFFHVVTVDQLLQLNI